MCGYCGAEFGNPADWNHRLDHILQEHSFRVCNDSKKYHRADLFHQHIRHHHAGTSGSWTKVLEAKCMRNELPPPQPVSVADISYSNKGTLMLLRPNKDASNNMYAGQNIHRRSAHPSVLPVRTRSFTASLNAVVRRKICSLTVILWTPWTILTTMKLWASHSLCECNFLIICVQNKIELGTRLEGMPI
jgi:hypothetical protein